MLFGGNKLQLRFTNCQTTTLENSGLFFSNPPLLISVVAKRITFTSKPSLSPAVRILFFWILFRILLFWTLKHSPELVYRLESIKLMKIADWHPNSAQIQNRRNKWQMLVTTATKIQKLFSNTLRLKFKSYSVTHCDWNLNVIRWQ